MVILSNLNVWDIEKKNFVKRDLELEIDENKVKLTQKEIDASDLLALPPLFDIHVHFREPGYEYKETIETGSLAAFSSGIFTVLDMPNTNPITDSVKAITQKKEIARKQDYVDVLIAAALTETNHTELESIEQHCDAYKVFMSESFGSLSISYETIERSLATLEDLMSVKPIFFHAEDPAILELHKNEHQHHRKRPEEAEASAIQQILTWSEEYPNLKFHITHISSNLSIKILEMANRKNLTLDTCPRYIYFNQNTKMDSNIKQVNPPLRNAVDNEILLKSLATGLIDMVSSDHSPHSFEEKQNNSISGMPGVQELVPSIISLVNNGELEWERAIEALYDLPTNLFNLPEREIDSDLIILNANTPVEVSKEWIKSKAKWSPYENMNFTGQMIYAVKNGKVVYQNDL
ncbi:MAG: dihydroorotase family protein [Candidatus Heimdallarchaeota archaeon]|nr:dihydroorotase family protein [Candidatus Heimdallarchaeota archaeon]